MLTKPGVVRTIYDPAAGTGGVLSISEEHLTAMDPEGTADDVFGQELNPGSYAICKADMLIKGRAGRQQHHLRQHAVRRRQPSSQVRLHILNPPFGTSNGRRLKRKYAKSRNATASTAAGPGLPRVSDGSMLFSVHVEDAAGGEWRRAAGSGSCSMDLHAFHWQNGSGESEIRRYMLENSLRRGNHRPTDRHVLQHRHLDLRLDRFQSQARAAQGKCGSSMHRVLAQDAGNLGSKRGDERGADRRRQ